ncbi:helix-turn-helix transcriptional regulator [Streptomyces sp. NPDC059515]|uniref:helix-turn-helix transcriptional regulator n=1 Tax=Streptomyces sp. NPDC059515 TaxID=3346854 RepID=UPI0036CBDC6B
MHPPPPGLDAFRRHIADRMRTVRLWRNLTQEQLAHLAGVAPRTVVSIESGRHGFSTDVLYALARALDVTVSELVADDRT